MEGNTYKVLIIDDHPIIIEAYVHALEQIAKGNRELKFSIVTASNCDRAIDILKNYRLSNSCFDIVFLDIRLPPSKDKKILSGEDLGLKIRKVCPESRIIVSTAFNDNYRIHSILKNMNPEAYLVKNDISADELVETINRVLYDPPYYSKTVIKLLRKKVSNDLLLDEIDRKILFELSMGSKMQELPNMIPLSIAGIEKRKRHLKQVLNVKNSSDRELILKAKEKGFI